MSAATTNPYRIVQVAEGRTKSRSFLADAWRYLWRDRLTMAAIFVLLALTLVSVLGPPIFENATGIDPNRTNVIDKYKFPGEDGHVLGTDQLGRDEFVRLMLGGRIALGIAYAASFLSIFIGVVVGIIAAYYGGIWDDLFVWLITTLTSIPYMFLLIIAAIIWTPSPTLLILILALLSWVDTARIVRGEVLSLRESEFVIAARSVGAPSWRIMLSHLLPNLLPIVIVNLAINAGVMILAESGLSFLGLGIQAPVPSWGNMLTDARTFFVKGPHLVVWPGIMISLAVICFYLIGDGLRDALDPRSVR